MGCTSSVYAFGKKKKKIIPQVSIFSPSLRVPVHSDIHSTLRGLIPKDLAHRITSLRNQIVLVAEDTGGSAIAQLTRALEEYLSLLLGLAKKEYGLQELVEFRWKELEDGRQEICVSNSWFELFSVLHMMAVLTLMEANLKLIPQDSGLSERLVSADCMRDAVDLLLKAAGYLNFCIGNVLPRLPPDIKSKLPSDMHESILEAISHQALAQGTEIQLGLAVQSHNATLSVKRRLACEQLSFFAQAHCCLSEVNANGAAPKKQLLFLKWKYLEAKAAAYYYHGLILDKGTEPSSHVSAVCCFLAAEELIAESKKACLTFCLAEPITRAPPPWGAMKHLHKKIPETASKKSQMYGYLLEQEKDLQNLPDLPEFQLSLKPDEYELPEVDSAWDCGKWEITEQTLKEHLNEDEPET
ncbi:UNVERIFIED_CONTAM: hypothetical protein Scaly_2083300 [Sesamum calycinum]|uniref:BRO1 domain-containing protein n=1 Tax=Sesamum calycinum TaxID=2727403 RepID=A0AAW2MLH4_9LAMI